MVKLFASNAATPKNAGFAPTSGSLNSPDNLAIDAVKPTEFVVAIQHPTSTNKADNPDGHEGDALWRFTIGEGGGCRVPGGVAERPARPDQSLIC